MCPDEVYIKACPSTNLAMLHPDDGCSERFVGHLEALRRMHPSNLAEMPFDMTMQCDRFDACLCSCCARGRATLIICQNNRIYVDRMKHVGLLSSRWEEGRSTSDPYLIHSPPAFPSPLVQTPNQGTANPDPQNARCP